ncbi:hypothetical protein JVU11DRAFT_10860 [Chiua virens]|nr:hypothetical protein JVU11DRAFT_10860 [Chiua virens]
MFFVYHFNSPTLVLFSVAPSLALRDAPKALIYDSESLRPAVRKGGTVEEPDRDEEDAPNAPCVAGELDTSLEMLTDIQCCFVFCVNPNGFQLPNQLEGRDVKGQIRSLGLTEVANVFEVGFTRDQC